MLARMLRWLIVLETGLYLSLAMWARSRGFVHNFGAVLCVLGMPLLMRALWVGGLCVWRAKSRFAGPALSRLSAGRWVAMGLREWITLIRCFGLLMPFEKRFMGADGLRPASGTTPVILVHGYRCNRGFLLWMRQALEARGHVVATLNLEPLLGDIDGYAAQLSKRIDEVLDATGASRVALIGHSMGGLVCLAYLRQHGGSRVAKLITLGTPFGGSALARFGAGRSALQMRPGSPWLAALAASPVALGVEITTLYSLHDPFVTPQAAVLEGARSVGFAGLAHLELAWSVPVLERVCATLETGQQSRQAA